MKKIILLGITCILLTFSFNTTVKALEGIDVSVYQSDIDFKKVSNTIDVVYIRSSAGNSYIDPKFERNYEEARTNNLKIGFYHYVTARNTIEAKEQAIFFAHTIRGKQTDCYLAMDFETFPGLSRNEINDISRVFLETVTRLTGKKAIVYSDAYNASRTFDKSISNNYPLWIAQYGVKSPDVKNWDTYYGWQYTDQGRVDGIDGYVDRDYFKDEILLNDNTPIKEPKLTNEEKTKIIYYRVKRGDTLEGIAKTYNVSETNLIRWNRLSNPNLLFPNEVLKIYTDYKYTITTTNNQDVYYVRKGNTLSYVASLYKVSVSNLVSWNKIKNPNLIYPGEMLIIKRVNNSHLLKYTVRPGNTLSQIAYLYKTSVYELQLINKLPNINLIYVGQTIYVPETYQY